MAGVCQAQIRLALIARTHAQGLDGCLTAVVVAGGPMSVGIRQQEALYDVGVVSEDTKAEMLI